MKIQLISEGAKVPRRADDGAAGYDLFVPEDIIVVPGRNVIKLGIKIELPQGYEGSIRPRSGFSAKGFEGAPMGQSHNKFLLQRYDADVCYGTIDENYRGEIGVIVKSYEPCPFEVAAGTRIAQMVITPYYVPESLEVTTSLSDTERGEGGFGSTGTH